MYGSEASIIFSEEGVPHPSVVKNSVGTRQGCSLGSMMFALMIHPYLVILAKEFPSVLILAYADDVSFVGSPEMVVACYKRWQELYTVELQGSLRDEKGVVYAQRPHSGGPPTSTLASLLNLDLPCEHEGLGGVMVPGIKVVHDGLRVLGAPIGSDAYKLAFAQARVEEVVVALETAALMPELQLQHCVSAGSLVHRINHLLRNIPGGDRFLYQEPMVRYDTAVIDVARRVARQTMLPLLAQQLASLPTRLGGLGYRTWAMTADAAFLAKYVHVSRQFQSLFPALCSQFPDFLSLGSEASAKLIRPMPPVPSVLFLVLRRLSQLWGQRARLYSATKIDLCATCSMCLPTSPRTRLMILLLRLLPKATTPPILATWPCTYPIAVTPPPLPWSQPAQPPHSRTTNSRRSQTDVFSCHYIQKLGATA